MRLRAAIAAASLLLLAACSQQELYAKLSERQANDMVAVLWHAGIPAAKQPRDGSSFAVSVASDQFASAVEVLRIGGYPHDDYDTLGRVFKKEGFVSSPLEERARLTHALSQEIANTIAKIDGVVLSRVHLSVPERDALADKPPPASASVFIKHRSGVDLSPQLGQIKALVVNSIQELPYERVTVVLFPAEPLPARIAESPLHRLSPTLWAAGLLSLAVLGSGGFMWWRQRRAATRGGRGLVPVAEHHSTHHSTHGGAHMKEHD
jgi:type III secretion protein J